MKLVIFLICLLSTACASQWPLRKCSSLQVGLDYREKAGEVANDREAEQVRKQVAQSYRDMRSAYVFYMKGLIANPAVSDRYLDNLGNKDVPFTLTANEKQQLWISLRRHRPKLAKEIETRE